MTNAHLNFSNPTSTTEAPLSATRFAAGPIKFAQEVELVDGERETSRPIELLARSNGIVEHSFWGPCVHDFAGLMHKPSIVLDYCHDSYELIGHAREFIVDENGLTLRGSIDSIELGDEADKILKRSARGIPYEASIYFSELLVEEIPVGETAEVNGQTLPGPLVIFRQWRLRACAVCPHGMDGATESKLSTGNEPVQFSWKGNSTVSKTSETDSASTDKTELSNPSDSNLSRDDLRSYIRRFGSDGGEYLSEGLSLESAYERHLSKRDELHKSAIDQLTAERDAAVEEARKFSEVLDQLQTGDEGLDTGNKQSGDSSPRSFADIVAGKCDKSRA